VKVVFEKICGDRYVVNTLAHGLGASLALGVAERALPSHLYEPLNDWRGVSWRGH